MKFSIGYRIKINCPNAPYHLCSGTVLNHITVTLYEVQVDGGLVISIDEMYLEHLKIEFKAGDSVGSHAARNGDDRWTVVQVGAKTPGDGGLLLADVWGKTHEVEACHIHYIFLDETVCQHDWKRLDLFRTTEFHCRRCKEVRPFDITRDAA